MHMKLHPVLIEQIEFKRMSCSFLIQLPIIIFFSILPIKFLTASTFLVQIRGDAGDDVHGII